MKQHRWLKWPKWFTGAQKARRFCIYCGTVETTHIVGSLRPGNYPDHSYSRGGVDLGLMRKVPPCHDDFVPAVLDGWTISLAPPPADYKEVKKVRRRVATDVHIYQAPPEPKCLTCGGDCGPCV